MKAFAKFFQISFRLILYLNPIAQATGKAEDSKLCAVANE
jgi:hypothetical protein